MSAISGRRVRCADPTSKWHGHVGTIKNFNSKNAGVAFDDDPCVPATGVWIKRALLEEVEGVAHDYGVWYAIAEHAITDDVSRRGPLLGCAVRGVMGRYSGCVAYDADKRTWFIDDCLYDGDDPPTHWILLPAVPA